MTSGRIAAAVVTLLALLVLLVAVRLLRLRAGVRAAAMAVDRQLQRRSGLLLDHEEVLSTENRVAFARQHYLDAVLRYDDARRTFPGRPVAAPAAAPR